MPSDYPDNVIFQNEVLEGQRLELSSKNFRYYLGPNLTLRRCTLILGMPSDLLHLSGAWFVDCTIEVKKQLKNVCWHKANLKGCRITGRLFSCDFGQTTNPMAAYHEDVGGIEDCDFTAAHLHACRFAGCDASTLRFPKWPYFTLLAPSRRSREIASIMWPREIRSWFTGFGEHHETTAAITYSAVALAKEAGVSEDRIKALLEGHSEIIYF
ncbi:MAG TPA: hypothetical protein VK539_17685 [Myxococcaceae bacterium]|nr:hypothetical protein [Myxococcaceae bacterium]